jgi:hypothetical protein
MAKINVKINVIQIATNQKTVELNTTIDKDKITQKS